MDTNLIKKTEKWVNRIYSNADHLIRTGYWIKRIYPIADEAMVIAAITHDIERAFPEGRTPPSPELKGAKWDDDVYNQWHGNRSAKYVREFLEKNCAPQDLIKKVVKLISHHESGGWKEADYLKDADSLSFLEINPALFISRIGKDLSRNEAKEKFNYMYRRIENKKAKALAAPFYKKALKELDENVKLSKFSNHPINSA